MRQFASPEKFTDFSKFSILVRKYEYRNKINSYGTDPRIYPSANNLILNGRHTSEILQFIE